jgi:hypothetical protein
MGYSEEDITPTGPVELIGFERPDNTSRGVLHKLLAQVSVWKTPEGKCCVVSVDSLGFTVELINSLRENVAAILETDRSKVMVCFSHTHAAPNAGTDEEYYNYVCERIIKAIKRAGEDLSPVKVAWGVTTSDIGINRRGCDAPFDSRLGILKITKAGGNDLKALILRVTAHGNVLTSDNYLISSDYFGVTRDLLEKKYDCKVILIQGPAGDIRPRYQQENAEYLELHSFEAAKREMSEPDKKRYFSQSIQALNKMADTIYKALAGVIDSLESQQITALSMFSVERRFYADVPGMEKARTIASEAKSEAGIDGTEWLNEVQRLHDEGIGQQFSDIEIQYFVVNDGCICGIPNEVMSAIALDILKKSDNPLLFFNGYTNGCNSYLPTAGEYDKGGYEVLWSNLIYYKYHGRVMPFNRDTGELLADEVVLYWKEFMKKKA